ncbi:S8 family serine peptidase [Serratia marcescens]|uniref:S8 family serine peptidase n=1 Tax=Serratia marcescens TaxID=615 RepID=UPI003F850C0C
MLENYLLVTNLTPEKVLNASSTSCGQTASYCVSAPGTEIYSASGAFTPDEEMTREEFEGFGSTGPEVAPRYKNETGTSMSAPLVSGAAAVLMQRFPYMTAGQISSVLKTTATDLGVPGIDKTFGWGEINLQDAINGPRMFITQADIPEELYVEGSYTEEQFVANIAGIGSVVEAGTSVERLCNSDECDYDEWSNDISGHGGLTKLGRGTLTLSGANTYLGDTYVNEGALAVNGSVT